MMTRIPLLALLLVSLAACSASETQPAKQPHPLVDARTLTLSAIQAPEYYITSGMVSSDHRIAISSRISGYIRAVLVREGDHVKKGQTLVRIDPVNAKQSLAQARADLADAKADLERYRKLLDAHAVSQRQFDKIALRFKVTRSRVVQAKNQLGYADISSPVHGIVVKKSMNAGDLAKPGASILTVEDVGQLLVETDVSASAVNMLHIGDIVDISISALHEARTGHIRQIVDAADPASHQFHIKIEPDSMAGIRAGMFAEVKFRIGTRRTMLVPEKAVLHRAGLTGIYIVDRHGITRYRQIRLGQKVKGGIEVAAGLSAGARIAWSENGGLRTGMRIRGAVTPAKVRQSPR